MRRGGSHHAVRHDRWDRDDLTRALADVPSFRAARKHLGKAHRTGAEAIEDAFFLLYKADPHLGEVAAEYRVNERVAAELADLNAFRRLRLVTVGDPLQAALNAGELEPHLAGVFDRLAVAQELAAQVAAALARIAELREQVERIRREVDKSSGTLSPDELQAALEAAQRLAEAQAELDLQEEVLEDAEAALDAELAMIGPDVAVTLADAVTSVAEDAVSFRSAARAWGCDQGYLQRLSPTERVALARKLNHPRMRQIADLFGRLRNLSLSLAAQHSDVFDEVVDLELGDDLNRVVPAELLALADETTELDFLARWSDRELTQYAIDSDDSGRGAIIMAIDGTGSMMTGERDVWAKAIMLVLLHLAREQHRVMHVIIFGYHQLHHLPFEAPEDFTVDRILDAASASFRSGTDFTAPMTKALDLLRAEHDATGRTTADVVFATDDECYVDEEFMADYLKEMHRMKARTWGICVTGCVDSEGPLTQMSEGRVMTVEDLTSGKELADLLVGIR